ncbi:Uncharacterised protein [Candidatus Norongarragalina meridionalis]|nr:Uncharacterised protein [Candidatus Norongarragalina meridionalis]
MPEFAELPETMRKIRVPRDLHEYLDRIEDAAGGNSTEAIVNTSLLSEYGPASTLHFLRLIKSARTVQGVEAAASQATIMLKQLKELKEMGFKDKTLRELYAPVYREYFGRESTSKDRIEKYIDRTFGFIESRDPQVLSLTVDQLYSRAFGGIADAFGRENTRDEARARLAITLSEAGLLPEMIQSGIATNGIVRAMELAAKKTGIGMTETVRNEEGEIEDRHLTGRKIASILLKTSQALPDPRKRLIIALRVFESGEEAARALGETALNETLEDENSVMDAIGLLRQTETEDSSNLLSNRIRSSFSKLEGEGRGETLRRAMDALGELATSEVSGAVPNATAAADTIRSIVLKDGKYVWTHDEVPPKRRKFLGLKLGKHKTPPKAIDYLFSAMGIHGNNETFAKTASNILREMPVEELMRRERFEEYVYPMLSTIESRANSDERKELLRKFGRILAHGDFHKGIGRFLTSRRGAETTKSIVHTLSDVATKPNETPTNVMWSVGLIRRVMLKAPRMPMDPTTKKKITDAITAGMTNKSGPVHVLSYKTTYDLESKIPKLKWLSHDVVPNYNKFVEITRINPLRQKIDDLEAEMLLKKRRMEELGPEADEAKLLRAEKETLTKRLQETRQMLAEEHQGHAVLLQILAGLKKRKLFSHTETPTLSEEGKKLIDDELRMHVEELGSDIIRQAHEYVRTQQGRELKLKEIQEELRAMQAVLAAAPKPSRRIPRGEIAGLRKELEDLLKIIG